MNERNRNPQMSQRLLKSGKFTKFLITFNYFCKVLYRVKLEGSYLVLDSFPSHFNSLNSDAVMPDYLNVVLYTAR